MRSRAAVAVSSLVAATAATGSPMKRTLSTQSACSSCDTGRIPNGIGRSFPVSTACTPSSARAALASIDTTRACGCVARSSLQYSMRGNARSSANLVVPVTFATASILRRAVPIMRRSDGLRAIERLTRWFRALSTHPCRSELDRFIDLDVARAAAEIARQRVLDFVACGLGIAGEQGLGGQQKCRRAISALGSAQIGKRLLQGMQLPGARHPLDCSDTVTRACKAEHETGQHRRSIEQHGTGPAFSQLAAVLGAGEPEIFAQHFEQRLVRREGDLRALAVDRESDHGLGFVAHGHCLI